MFTGINMFCARLRLILVRAVWLGLKRVLKGPKMIISMPKNINFITIVITLEGIEEIKPKKYENKTI